MNQVRRCLTILLLLSLAAGFSCRKKHKPVIAVVPKSQSHIFWAAVHAGAMSAGQEFGAEIRWNGPSSEADFTKQIGIVDDFINLRVQGIVLSPAHGESLVPIVERADQEKIPVVIFDSGIQTEKYLTYVSTDNYRAGSLAAERMGSRIATGEIAILGTIAGSVSTSERENGFRETLARKFPGVQVVDFQYGLSDRARSTAVAHEMLAAHPNLAGMFCSNESGTLGAVQAAKSRGVAAKIKIVGFDSSPVLIADLQAGNLDALVLQNPFRMGYLGVKAVVDRLNGHTPEKRIDTGATVVTASNLNEPAIRELINPPIGNLKK
jgi:ribose transport system substrate-binding protein